MAGLRAELASIVGDRLHVATTITHHEVAGVDEAVDAVLLHLADLAAAGELLTAVRDEVADL